ncbi:Zinc finger CXXC-type [Trinorchestia longiramus]|nr:Zinc finger CXXC-type [Trinorchestia longiramus]
MSTKMEHKPKLRERKERKLYSDDWALGDEEIEGYHTFDLDDKIKTDKFSGGFVKDMTDVDFSLSYFQKNGFNWPLLFKTKDKLGICVPGDDFTINDVRMAVGSRRMLDVMDVNTQKNVEMTMKDWQRYFESKDKDKLLNVISLEFSHTKLENLVHAPTVVRQIDWVEKVWPRHLKEAQTEATNVLEDMMYPKVQKYCLMSVGGCYTDFHIDFGGTSVWYHILKGKKIFWLIPPTEANLQLYEQWVLSGKQGDVFFGDTVEKCERIELFAGNTFFIPTGWIHAVYTPVDSLVFGGNFLHSYGIEKQLRVAQVEDTTHVPQKFRYPFFTEMLWYVLERYVHVLLGRTHLCLPPSEHEKLLAAVKKMNSSENAENNEEPNDESKHVHLTRYELHGLKAIVMYLHSLPNTRKNVPDLVADPVPLIQDVKTLVEVHRFDRPELAMTSKPVLEWWQRDPMRFGIKRTSSDGQSGVKRPRGEGPIVRVPPPNVSKTRYRRTRCRVCENCTRPDCRQCSFCIDMTRYGGSGILKQRCKLKKCPRPLLPAPAVCYLCGLDGRMLSVYEKKVKDETPSSLMECSICFKVCHPNCIDFPGVEGVINEDYPNSWECPECITAGYDKEYKGTRGRLSAASSSDSSATVGCHPKKLSELDTNTAEDETKVKLADAEPAHLPTSASLYDRNNSPPGPHTLIAASTNFPKQIELVPKSNGETAPPPMPTWEQLQARVSKPLVAPQWVVRPAPIELSRADAGLVDYDSPLKNSKPANMSGLVLLCVFKLLPVSDLLAVMRVCREWARWAIHPSLWQHIILPTNKPVRHDQLEGIVRRQPGKLTLNWVQVTQPQLKWLLMRLPQLSELEMEGLCWGEVREIATCYCPPLSKLNLNFVQGINDDTVALMFSSPVSKRPGFRNQQCTRLKNLTHLSLSNALITDVSVKLICSQLRLIHLDLSSCVMVTEDTISILIDNLASSLESLDVRACPSLTVFCLPELAKLKLLSWLGLENCNHIPEGAIRAWAQTHGYTEVKKGILARIPPTVKKVSMAVQSRLVKSAFQEILKTHIQKLSQRSAVVSPNESKTGSLAQSDAANVQTDEVPDESLGSAIAQVTEEKCDLSNTDCNITSPSSQLSTDRIGSVDLLQESTEENSQKQVRCPTPEKEEHCSLSERNALEKTAEKEGHSEEKSPRFRRRPSRFADSDGDFTSSMKNSRKNLKLVTVELEDIGSASNLSCKLQDTHKESRDEEVSVKKPFVGPKSKWLARAEASKERSDDSFSSSEDSRMLPPSTSDTEPQPRRTQRRSRDLHDVNKIGTASKLSSYVDFLKDDIEKPADYIRSTPADEVSTYDKKQTSPIAKKERRREKDIITRSKKLKQQPVKEINLSEKEEFDQEGSSTKKSDVEFTESIPDTELEHVKMTIKTSEQKILKRERSSSSEPTQTKKIDKQKSNLSSKYSAKLRKKSCEGSPSQEIAYTVDKNAKENLKQKKKLYREDETSEETSVDLNDEVFKCSSTSSARQSKRKSDDSTEHKKVMDPKRVKMKKIMSSKSDFSSVHLSSNSKIKKNNSGTTRGGQDIAETEALEGLRASSSAKSDPRENREKTTKLKKKDDRKANHDKKRESVSFSGRDGVKSFSKKVNLEKRGQKINIDAVHKKNKFSEPNLNLNADLHEAEHPLSHTESVGAKIRKTETGHTSGDKIKQIKDLTTFKERKKLIIKNSMAHEAASKFENKRLEEESLGKPNSGSNVVAEVGNERGCFGKISLSKGAVNSESFASSHTGVSKAPVVQACGHDKNVLECSEESGTKKDGSSLDISSVKQGERSLCERTSTKSSESRGGSEITTHSPLERKKDSKSENSVPLKQGKSSNIPSSLGTTSKISDSSPSDSNTSNERKTSNIIEEQNVKSFFSPSSSGLPGDCSETKSQRCSTEVGLKIADASAGKRLSDSDANKTKAEKSMTSTGAHNLKTDHEGAATKAKSSI